MESGQTKSFASLFGKDPEKAKEERLTKLNQQIRDVSIAPINQSKTSLSMIFIWCVQKKSKYQFLDDQSFEVF